MAETIVSFRSRTVVGGLIRVVLRCAVPKDQPIVGSALFLSVFFAAAVCGCAPKANRQATNIDSFQPVVSERVDSFPSPDSLVPVLERAAEEAAVLPQLKAPVFVPPDLPSHVKEQRQPRTTPSRRVAVVVSDTVPTYTQIFYYSPRMEHGAYAFRQELGSDNNFLGITDTGNRALIEVPDSVEEGAKVLFRTTGYAPLDVDMSALLGRDEITVRFMPVIYTNTVVLKERIFRDTLPVISSVTLNETPTKAFYGECLPLFDDWGNHSDPSCAFLCLGCLPELNFGDFGMDLRELGALYRALKEREPCIFLISAEHGMVKSMEIEALPDGLSEEFRQQMLTEERWRVISDGAHSWHRVHFVAEEAVLPAA